MASRNFGVSDLDRRLCGVFRGRGGRLDSVGHRAGEALGGQLRGERSARAWTWAVSTVPPSRCARVSSVVRSSASRVAARSMASSRWPARAASARAALRSALGPGQRQLPGSSLSITSSGRLVTASRTMASSSDPSSGRLAARALAWMPLDDLLAALLGRITVGRPGIRLRLFGRDLISHGLRGRVRRRRAGSTWPGEDRRPVRQEPGRTAALLRASHRAGPGRRARSRS